MASLVLRKSHGAYSAGTEVMVLDRDKRHKMNLCYVRGGDEIHVHDNDLVQRRDMTDVFDRPPRWVRRNRLNENVSEVKPQASEETGTIIRF